MDTLIVFVLLVGVLWLATAGGRKRAHEAQANQKQIQRLKATEVKTGSPKAHQLAQFFYQDLGYMAHQALPPAAVREMIDEGLSAEDLATLFWTQIDGLPGVILGHHLESGERIDAKLTEDYRARHMYVIGRSGSGKTNLLRTLIFQDLEAGRGGDRTRSGTDRGRDPPLHPG